MEGPPSLCSSAPEAPEAPAPEAPEDTEAPEAPEATEDPEDAELVRALADLPPMSPLSDCEGYLTPPDGVLSQSGMTLEDLLWEAGFGECASPTESEEDALLGYDWLGED